MRDQERGRSMPIEYKNVVPWGRRFDEYCQMFDLTESDFKKAIISCGDGPASFNFEATKKGYSVTSIDPIYFFTKEEIQKRINETYEIVLEETCKNKEYFVWKSIKDIDTLGKLRMEAMQLFLDDFDKGLREKRYIPGELPSLNFQELQFDIAICSHFLFLYSDNLSLEFHIQSIEEMLRIADEVRIFPIINMNLTTSKYYSPTIQHFQNKHLKVSEILVDYEFQKGGNKMLSIENVKKSVYP